MVNFDGNESMVGRFLDVQIVESLPNSLRGDVVNNEFESLSKIKNFTPNLKFV